MERSFDSMGPFVWDHPEQSQYKLHSQDLIFSLPDHRLFTSRKEAT